jgi:hypothetical protein
MKNKYSFRNILDNAPELFKEHYENNLKSSPNLGRYKSNINLKGEDDDDNDKKMGEQKSSNR